MWGDFLFLGEGESEQNPKSTTKEIAEKPFDDLLRQFPMFSLGITKF